MPSLHEFLHDQPKLKKELNIILKRHTNESALILSRRPQLVKALKREQKDLVKAASRIKSTEGNAASDTGSNTALNPRQSKSSSSSNNIPAFDPLEVVMSPPEGVWIYRKEELEEEDDKYAGVGSGGSKAHRKKRQKEPKLNLFAEFAHEDPGFIPQYLPPTVDEDADSCDDQTYQALAAIQRVRQQMQEENRLNGVQENTKTKRPANNTQHEEESDSDSDEGNADQLLDFLEKANHHQQIEFMQAVRHLQSRKPSPAVDADGWQVVGGGGARKTSTSSQSQTAFRSESSSSSSTQPQNKTDVLPSAVAPLQRLDSASSLESTTPTPAASTQQQPKKDAVGTALQSAPAKPNTMPTPAPKPNTMPIPTPTPTAPAPKSNSMTITKPTATSTFTAPIQPSKQEIKKGKGGLQMPWGGAAPVSSPKVPTPPPLPATVVTSTKQPKAEPNPMPLATPIQSTLPLPSPTSSEKKTKKKKKVESLESNNETSASAPVLTTIVSPNVSVPSATDTQTKLVPTKPPGALPSYAPAAPTILSYPPGMSAPLSASAPAPTRLSTATFSISIPPTSTPAVSSQVPLPLSNVSTSSLPPYNPSSFPSPAPAPAPNPQQPVNTPNSITTPQSPYHPMPQAAASIPTATSQPAPALNTQQSAYTTQHFSYYPMPQAPVGTAVAPNTQQPAQTPIIYPATQQSVYNPSAQVPVGTTVSGPAPTSIQSPHNPHTTLQSSYNAAMQPTTFNTQPSAYHPASQAFPSILHTITSYSPGSQSTAHHATAYDNVPPGFYHRQAPTPPSTEQALSARALIRLQEEQRAQQRMLRQAQSAEGQVTSHQTAPTQATTAHQYQSPPPPVSVYVDHEEDDVMRMILQESMRTARIEEERRTMAGLSSTYLSPNPSTSPHHPTPLPFPTSSPLPVPNSAPTQASYYQASQHSSHASHLSTPPPPPPPRPPASYTFHTFLNMAPQIGGIFIPSNISLGSQPSPSPSSNDLNAGQVKKVATTDDSLLDDLTSLLLS
eukprot:CAMPEP_0184648100 /NCGR_PEP_ID=MMETSP0308-20130426/5181_1 /TAXON_ID=38269 /ORGANISM="Gloeochaete witrockiana, Strain SAG 46.84" /LENGTH=1008 /DNA_ID=CAMNT_0027079679 /DNA_START=246 /DNA_END=3272 /DNA_ORIENTATION=+